MTATSDLTASGAGLAPTSAAAGPAQEMADQMAEVAGAMFAFLLLRAPDLPVHHDVPHAAAAEPADLPVLEAPAAPALIPSVPALAVALAAIDIDLDPSPVVPAGIPAIAMPTSLPMPGLIPQIEPAPADGPAPSAPDVTVPVIVSTPAPTLAMLSEIEFLDE